MQTANVAIFDSPELRRIIRIKGRSDSRCTDFQAVSHAKYAGRVDENWIGSHYGKQALVDLRDALNVRIAELEALEQKGGSQ